MAVSTYPGVFNVREASVEGGHDIQARRWVKLISQKRSLDADPSRDEEEALPALHLLAHKAITND